MIESKDTLPVIAISAAAHDNAGFQDTEEARGPSPALPPARYQKGGKARRPAPDAWIDARPSLISAGRRASQDSVLSLDTRDYHYDYDSEA